MTPYHLRPKPPESRGTGVASDQNDGRYFVWVGGEPVDVRDVEAREKAFGRMNPKDEAESDSFDFALYKIRGLSTHNFNGNVYRVFGNAKDDRGWGWTDKLDVPDRLLWIHDRHPFDVFLLMVLVHEALHACLNHFTEEQVEIIANDVAAFLGKYLLAKSDDCRKGLGLKPLMDTDTETLEAELRDCVGKFLGESRRTSDGSDLPGSPGPIQA